MTVKWCIFVLSSVFCMRSGKASVEYVFGGKKTLDALVAACFVNRISNKHSVGTNGLSV